jgi:hypothetical protein
MKNGPFVRIYRRENKADCKKRFSRSTPARAHHLPQNIAEWRGQMSSDDRKDQVQSQPEPIQPFERNPAASVEHPVILRIAG